MANSGPRLDRNREHESNLGRIRIEENFTQAQLGNLAGCSAGIIALLQTGMSSPYYLVGKRLGQIKPYVERICLVLKASLAELFPRYICNIDRFRSIEVPFVQSQMPGRFLSQWIHNQSNTGKLIDNMDLAEQTRKSLAMLSPREEKILRMHFGIGKEKLTLQEISEIYGTTRERIRQIEARALRKLRHPTRSRALAPFLDGVVHAFNEEG